MRRALLHGVSGVDELSVAGLAEPDRENTLSRQNAAMTVESMTVLAPAFCSEAKRSGERPAPMPASW